MAVLPTASLIEQASLRAGSGSSRNSNPEDIVDGIQPRAVVEPTTANALAETLAWATSSELKTLIAGNRTKLSWGAPSGPIDLMLSTSRMDRILEHRHGDLTATIEAGAPLASVNEILAAHGQRLPWDPPWSHSSTIGGIVATNDSGPSRHGSGSPRDSIIGISIARIDGELVKAGGIVVKNVAGYDLARLFTGSFGCLGIILSATFKLAPIPPASKTVIIDVDSFEAIEPIVHALDSSSLTPTAIEISSDPLRLLVKFESIETAANQQAKMACALVGNAGNPRVITSDEEQLAWRHHFAHWTSDGTLIKLSTVPAELVQILVWCREETVNSKLAMTVAGRAGLGVVDIRVEGELGSQIQFLSKLREKLLPGRGSAVIRQGSVSLRHAIDTWGPVGDSLRVMKAIKKQFDPTKLLNAGRGPGGL